MKELVIISGKGGTGKTSIVGAFAALAENKVLVDCDVDAADLHLILNPEIETKTDFYSGKEAILDSDRCIQCGKCIELCRFNAISKDYEINRINCEGCGVCTYFCPNGAIELNKKLSGEWYISNTRFGKMVHAKLGIAEENSGKLVTTIRNQARLIANQNKNELIIVDGSPGIGCPVIASISGANLVLIVTEPTLSGLHDLERVYQLTRHFKVKASVCVNKYDLNPDLSGKIKEFCQEKNLNLLGEIPYSKEFTKAQIERLTIIEHSKGLISNKINDMWERIKLLLEGENS
ncbi:MAG: (4Fe-4S)-binding protein [Candidatus Melainabacteria bacterium RIFOXYA12_FULL_32_12]|nr:MAG: (4Fe-4S)-binding protein [Candidatus Melainabacteria bacterium RIFOXYA2_FULL_32_9]OGI31267.1 MAG: (4Fe-4S)-binding protein [Candidatus Melainabacteria bacterium RIFOXYA12_FULL_32_12]